MASVYPGAVDPKPSIDTADMSAPTTHATDRGLLWDAIRATQTELGTTPSGLFSTVKARLDDIDTDITAKLSLTGGTLTGPLVLPAGTPAATEAVRKDHLTTMIAAAPYVETAGDTMTGTLLINAGGGATALDLRNSTQDPTVAFKATVGTAYAYVKGTAGGLTVQSEADIALLVNNAERVRMTGSNILIGKASSNLATAGVEIHSSGVTTTGTIRPTISAAAIQNISCRHVSSADANTESFIDFVAGGAVRGSVTQVSTTGVAYNTTSDERLKTVLRDLDDDEIATILRLIAPVVFEFNSDPGNEHVGFIAQQLAATWPTFLDVGIVTPGRGEPGDEDEYDDDGEQTGYAFRPWMVDLAKLVPLLVAGWQQLDSRLTALENP